MPKVTITLGDGFVAAEMSICESCGSKGEPSCGAKEPCTLTIRQYPARDEKNAEGEQVHYDRFRRGYIRCAEPTGTFVFDPYAMKRNIGQLNEKLDHFDRLTAGDTDIALPVKLPLGEVLSAFLSPEPERKRDERPSDEEAVRQIFESLFCRPKGTSTKVEDKQ